MAFLDPESPDSSAVDRTHPLRKQQPSGLLREEEFVQLVCPDEALSVYSIELEIDQSEALRTGAIERIERALKRWCLTLTWYTIPAGFLYYVGTRLKGTSLAKWLLRSWEVRPYAHLATIMQVRIGQSSYYGGHNKQELLQMPVQDDDSSVRRAVGSDPWRIE
ncbi:hypothetical protein Slin15195_G119420 [Septoria linicola]|uniref:Uncharacterized protein n=1 Tax=Septoria linicola TaxID=215465 RepID=A0A9Q9ERJ1_9PEZI|nr:hypothetical protein Slin14017_G096410 [Septoria linicola]USW58623.1 hypothetical protein Slin15195_G119420 [Septoria linicola]